MTGSPSAILSRAELSARDRSRCRVVFDIVCEAAAQGRRCPTTDEMRWAGAADPVRCIGILADLGLIHVEVGGRNWRQVWICAGEHKGRATAPRVPPVATYYTRGPGRPAEAQAEPVKRSPVDELIRRLYRDDQMSLARIAETLTAEYGVDIAPETVRDKLERMGVTIRTQAEAQAVRHGGTKRCEASMVGPVEHRPPAPLPVEDESGIPYPTRERLMGRR